MQSGQKKSTSEAALHKDAGRMAIWNDGNVKVVESSYRLPWLGKCSRE